MFRFGPLQPPLFFRLLLTLAVLSVSYVRSEVIYDNSSTFLGRFVTERGEYGDQVDLGGSARRLTDLLFEYYGEFQEDGDEMVKVRLYSNEVPYDNFRKAPTTLLFESGWLPIQRGYHTHALSGLNVLLPLHTVTFTAEFSGVDGDEIAGLLFYGPPTTGYSFNEFWLRNSLGNWMTIFYDRVDPTKRANASLRMIAVADVAPDQVQSNSTATQALRDGTNSLRFAQTFTADVTGRFDHLVVSMQFTGAPVRVRILDTFEGRPGPNVLATANLVRGVGSSQALSFYDAGVYLEKGLKYAIELSTAAEPAESPSYLLPVAGNAYSRGDLWARPEAGGSWAIVTENNAGVTPLDALFETHMIPAEPDARLVSPAPNQIFDFGEPFFLRAQHHPPPIGVISRVIFQNGTQEIAVITNAPYQFTWTNAPAGEHNLRAIAEDSFRRPFRSDFVTVTVRPAGAPDNDLFARRIALHGTRLRRVKPSDGATVEPNEPGLRTNNPAGATLWWSWTAYNEAPVTITSQHGSSQNASVSVFTGTAFENLVPMAHGSPSVRFVPAPGVTYAISIDPETRGDQVVLDLSTGGINQFSRLADGRISMEVTPPIVAGTNRLEFSHDLITWSHVFGTAFTNGHPTAWIDSGPPGTPSHPSVERARFYRLMTE